MTESQKLRVLVVEDVPDISDSYKFHLERAGYVVDVVDTRRGAVEALKSKYYDVALVDLSLKDDVTFKGGIDVLDAINKLHDGTKAIVASATSEIKDSVASYDRGIKGFIMKGAVTSKSIVEKIEEALKGHRRPLFGDFATLTAYLAAPEVTPIWEGHVEAALGCGYESMQKILWKALSTYLPILRTRDGSTSLTIDKGRAAVAGMFWSKAEGCAIWLSIRGERGSFLEPNESAPSRLADIDGKKVSAAIWRINVARDQFLETIRDQPGPPK
jgi:CheY-like chemotaxis protein